jgi:tRNA(Ile)-lysidine synthase TilS/MesJ
MIFLPEKHVIHMQKELDLPVLKNPCPADGYTKRQEMKELLAELTKRYPTLKDSMLSALKNEAQYSLWNMAPVPANSPLPVWDDPEQE